MLQYDITASVRNTFGKGAARTLRRAGQTPAVLYGSKLEPVALELETKPLTKTLLEIQRRNAVIKLSVKGGKKKEDRHVMIKELQTDPITDSLIHADFFEISLDSPMTLSVPVNYVGKAKGVDLGGFLEEVVRELPLTGLVMDFPDSIDVDVTKLDIGDKITCKDLSIPEKMTSMMSEDTVCVTVTAAGGGKGMAEEEVAEEEAAPATEAPEAPAEE